MQRNLSQAFTIFYDENFLDTLEKLVKKYAPFGKIAIFFEDGDDLDKIKKVGDFIEKLSSKTVYISFPKNKRLSVNLICPYFALHEDVRLVITFNQNLNAVCEYFCSIRKIPFVLLSQTFCPQFYNPNVLIENDNKIDLYQSQCEKCVIIGTKNLPKPYQVLQMIFLKKAELFERFYISRFENLNINENDAKNLYQKLIDAEERLKGDENSVLEVISSLSSIFIFDRYNGGQILFNGFIEKFCIFEDVEFNVEKQFLLTKKLLKLTYNALKDNDNKSIVDYNELIEQICKIKNLDKKFLASSLLSQLDLISKIKKDSFLQFKNSFYSLYKYLCDESLTLNSYLNNNQRLTKRDITFITFASAISFNLSSLRREITSLSLT